MYSIVPDLPPLQDDEDLTTLDDKATPLLDSTYLLDEETFVLELDFTFSEDDDFSTELSLTQRIVKPEYLSSLPRPELSPALYKYI